MTQHKALAWWNLLPVVTESQEDQAKYAIKYGYGHRKPGTLTIDEITAIFIKKEFDELAENAKC